MKNKAELFKLIKIIFIVLIIMFIFVFVVKNGDMTGERSVTYVQSSYSRPMNNLEVISTESSNGTNGSYDVGLEEMAENIINDIKNVNNNSRVLSRYLGSDEEVQKKFIAKLIKAEYVTQYPDLRSADQIGQVIDDPYEFQGCIQIKRATSQTEGSTGNSQEQFLEYMNYDDFMALVDSNNMDALNYFTLRTTQNLEGIEEGQLPENNEEEQEIELVVATYNKKDIDITTNDDEVNFETEFENAFQEQANDDGTRTATSTQIDLDIATMAYQSITDSYAMTFDMLWSMLVVGQDVDFVSDLAQLALDSKIIITVQDNLNVTTDIVNYTYQKQIDEKIDIKIQVHNDATKTAESSFEKDTVTLPSEEDKYYKNSKTVNTVNTVVIDVTYADTWILEYRNSYNNEIVQEHETFNQVYTKENKEDLEDTQAEPIINMYNSSSHSQEELEAIEEPFESAGATNSAGKTIPIWKQEFKQANTQVIENTVQIGTAVGYINELLQDATYNVNNNFRVLLEQNPQMKNQMAEIAIIMDDTYGTRKSNYIMSQIVPRSSSYASSANSIIDDTHNRCINNWPEPTIIEPEIIIQNLKTERIDRVINKKEEVKNLVAYNTYTRGTPIIREKTNAYSCYSTIGLDWTKHFENGSVQDYLNGEGSYSDYVAKYVTEDKQYYICYGEQPLNDTYNYGYGLMFRNGNDWQIENLRFLYKGIYGLQDTTAISDETILREFTENEARYCTRGESKLAVEIVDNAVFDEYSNKRSELYNDIESAQEDLGGRGIEEFSIPQLDILTDRYYNGWSNRRQHVKEIYEIVMKVNNGTSGYTIDLCQNLIKDGREIYRSRDNSRWATFSTGEYTICDESGNVTEIIDQNGYDEHRDVERDYNFIILMNQNPAAKRSIISGAQILFDALRQSPSGSEQIDTIKWLLNELTGDDSRFDVEEINWDRLLESTSTYTRTTGNSLETYIKAWENYELWQYESGIRNVVPSRYIERIDGDEYYKVYENKISYNIIVEDKQEGELVEKSEGQALFEEKVDYCTSHVEAYINEKGLDLSGTQKDVLVAITYKNGLNYLERNQFAEKYIENPEEINNTFPPFIGDSGQNNANYHAFSEEELLDPEGNIIEVGAGNLLEAAGYIQAQMGDYDYCVYSPGDRCQHTSGHACGLPSTFERAQTVGPKNCCCATLVSWSLIEAGYDDIISYVENRNYCPSLHQGLMASGEFIKINGYNELQPGDIVFMDTHGGNNGELGHVQIYAGEADGDNAYYYNAGSVRAMRQPIQRQSHGYVRGKFVFALRMK